MRKGLSSEHLLFHSRRCCGAEMSKGMENCSQNLGLLFGRNGIFQKAEGKGWKGLMERGIHRPRKGVSGEFFLGSSHWAAMGRSKGFNSAGNSWVAQEILLSCFSVSLDFGKVT